MNIDDEYALRAEIRSSLGGKPRSVVDTYMNVLNDLMLTCAMDHRSDAAQKAARIRVIIREEADTNL